MNSVLLWLGGLLVAVLGLLFAVPYVVDWNAYRGVFEEEASRVLGRDVRVGGQVNLRLLPSPYVRFEKVRISDAGAALGEPFFRAEAFTLWLSPAPLLRGAIEASELELDRPVLRLAVDQEGRGNWQALKITPGALPFLPSDVVLQQVRIQNGIVSLKMPGTPEPLTLSGIEGEVAAASLDGPYRFRGLVDWHGSPRGFRIATSTREADGKLRYKASVRGADTGNLYSLDGVLSELTTRGRHSGTLTARLPLATLLAAPAGTDASSRARSTRASDAVDLKASYEGDLDGIRLTDLSFAFEQDGKPQLMTGEAQAGWRNGLRLVTTLSSRWLDLDNIVGQDGKSASPAILVRRMIGQLGSLLPTEGSSLLTIDVDQVNLGGEALSGVRLALARAGGLVSIGELKAALPGNARGEIRGSFDPARSADTRGTTEVFDGEMLLRGPSYQRFAAWAGAVALVPPAGSKDAPPDAPFSIASRLRLMPDGLALANASIELGSRQVQATADWKWGAEPRLEIAAESRAVDISAFAPGSLDLTAAGAEPAAAGTRFADTGSTVLMRLADRVAAIERAVGSLRLRLRAAELGDGRSTLRDVDADLTVKGGTLSIASLRAGGGGAPRVELQGEIARLRGKPDGTIRGWVSADSREAVGGLLQLLPSGGQGQAARWLRQAAKADLGFTLTLGGGASEQVALAADGVVDGARLVLDLKLDGGLAQWRDAPIDLALRLDGVPAAAIVQRMAGRTAAPAAPAEASSGVVLQVRAAGASASSLIAAARLDAGSAATASTAVYKGRAGIAADGSIELAGELSLAAPGATDLLALAGAGRHGLLADTAVRGTLDVARKAGVTTLSTRALEIGTGRVGGRMTLAAKGERTRLDGQLAADRVSIAGLMRLVLAGEPARTRGEDGGETAGGAPSPWPDAPFALGLLDHAEGQLTIAAPLAGLTPELEIADTETRLAFTPGRLEIQSLTGAALGGRFSARGTIEATSPGAGVAIEVRLTGAQLARLTATGTRAGSGEANLMLTLSGRALTPRAVMAVATGKGEVEIRNGRVPGLAATLVEKAALAAIEGSEEINRAALERIVTAERGRGEVVLGNRKLGLEIADGALKLGALEIAAPEAQLRNITTVDLATLKADSEWQVAPRRALPGRSGGPRRDPLPSLALVWTGPLAGIARSEPRLSLEALERELTFRRAEREAERLEERGRQDAERSREIERLKRMEGPERGTSVGAPAAAPPIEAPLPVSPAQQAVPAPTAAAPSGAAPADKGAPDSGGGARVVRPPPRPPAPRRETKTLQDLLMGQQ